MTLNEVTELEVQQLDSVTMAYCTTVRTVVEEIRGEKVWMTLNKKDRYRLLTLNVWSDRYKVSLKYILSVLLPVWEHFIQKNSRKAKQRGLNVRVATLTGKKSLQILLDQITKDFPDNLQKLEWAEQEKQRILFTETERREKQDDDIPTRKKSLADFDQLRGYVRQYRKRIQSESKMREQIVEEMQKRNYRNNPFRQETV